MPNFERLSHVGAAVPTALQTGIGTTDTTCTVVLDTGWPTASASPFYVVVDQGNPQEEKMLITQNNAGTLTIGTRGADNTVALTHQAGAPIEVCWSADEADEANQHYADTTIDNHTQYLNTARHDITTRHTFGAALGTPAAASGLTPSSAAATGTGALAAREDHVHAMSDFSDFTAANTYQKIQTFLQDWTTGQIALRQNALLPANPNLLSADDADFEGGTGTWSAFGYGTVTQSSAKALHGSYSMAMTGDGTTTLLAFSANYPALAGQSYTLAASAIAASTPRGGYVRIQWINSSGGNISNVQSSPLDDSTLDWTRWSVSGVAPAGTVNMQFSIVYNETIPANEVHYIDMVSVTLGPLPENIVPDTTDLHTWQPLPTGFSIVSSPLGGNMFSIAGDSSSYPRTTVTSQNFPILSSTTYILSMYLNAASASSGDLTVYLYDQSDAFLGSLNQPAGSQGVVSASVTTLSSSTYLFIEAGTGGITIPVGSECTLAQPQLTATSTAQPYTPGVNWTRGGIVSYFNFGPDGGVNISNRVSSSGTVKALTSVTANYTVNINDEIVLASASTAALTVTLPHAAMATGQVFAIKKTDSTANAVTVEASSGNVDGAASVAMTTQNEAIHVVSDGTNYWVVGQAATTIL